MELIRGGLGMQISGSTQQNVASRSAIKLHGIITLCLLLTVSGIAAEPDRLAQLRSKYEKARRLITASHLDKVGRLDRGYGKALDYLLARERKAGNLDGVQAVLKETERFKTDGIVLAIHESHASIAEIQRNYNAQLDGFEADKAKRLTYLAEKYGEALASVERELVIAEKLDEAAALRKERDTISQDPTLAFDRDLLDVRVAQTARKQGEEKARERQAEQREHEQVQRKEQLTKLTGPVTLSLCGKRLELTNNGVKREGTSFWFDGESWLDLDRKFAPDISGKRRLRISATFSTDAKDGVIVAYGGNRNGIAVYLEEGRLVFAQVSDWKRTVVSSEPLANGEHTFEAVRHTDGRLTLELDGQAAGSAEGHVLLSKFGDSLQIGADLIQPVGEYQVPNLFRGVVRRLSIR
jgi:hypothetical protein